MNTTNFNHFTFEQNSTTAVEWLNTTDKAMTLNFTALLVTPIIFMVAMGNILVIVAVGVDRKLRSATNCFLSSLAVADLLVALTVMPPSLSMIINNYKWPFNDDLCGAWVMLDVFFSTSSILHLCMISFDRYVALALPFRQRSNGSSFSVKSSTRLGVLRFSQNKPKTMKRVARRIALVWTIAFGIALPLPIMGKFDRNNIFAENNFCAINIADFQIYGSLVAFFLPLIIMFIMYTLTIRTLRGQASMVSSLLVHNGKNSPPSVGRRTSFRRKGSSQLPPDACHRCIYTGRQYQRRQSAITAEENGSLTDSAKSLACANQPQNVAIFPHNKCYQTVSHRHRKERKSPPINKALSRLKQFLCLDQISKEKNNKAFSNSSSALHRLNCVCERSILTRDEPERSLDGNFNRFQRKYRSSVRRISNSFKNKAMKSITNEQRASKVLGLIFVLFCVFWCPFFITNVTSRLCTTCDQNLLGKLMNWFVWVGYVSSGVNPCVYTLFSRRFRETFHLLIRCKMSEISQRKLIRSFCRRDSSAVSVRSTGEANTTRSSKTSTLPALKDVDEVQESLRSPPVLNNDSSSKRSNSNVEQSPLLDSYEEPQYQHRIYATHILKLSRNYEKLYISDLTNKSVNQQKKIHKRYFKRFLSDSDAQSRSALFRFNIFRKTIEDTDFSEDILLDSNSKEETCLMTKETSSNNFGKSAVDLKRSETSANDLLVNDKQNSPPIYFDRIADINKTQSHKKDDETFSFLPSPRNGIALRKSSIKATQKTPLLVTKSPVICRPKPQKSLSRSRSF